MQQNLSPSSPTDVGVNLVPIESLKLDDKTLTGGAQRIVDGAKKAAETENKEAHFR